MNFFRLQQQAGNQRSKNGRQQSGVQNNNDGIVVFGAERRRTGRLHGSVLMLSKAASRHRASSFPKCCPHDSTAREKMQWCDFPIKKSRALAQIFSPSRPKKSSKYRALRHAARGFGDVFRWCAKYIDRFQDRSSRRGRWRSASACRGGQRAGGRSRARRAACRSRCRAARAGG